MRHGLRHHKLLTALGIVVTILVLAVISLIIFSEPLARWLIEQGEERVGREIEIEKLDIDWHWGHTAVHAENIKLANAPDYPDPNMVTINKLDLTFNPWKLLVGKVEFDKIFLDQLHVVLDKKTDDDANWQFAALENKDEEADVAENRHQIPLIEQLQLKDGKIIYRDAIRGLSLDLDLNSVIGDGSGDDGGMSSGEGFNIAGTGTIQEQEFKLEAAGESLQTLRDTNKEFPLFLKVIMGDTEISVDGTFQDPIKLTGVDAILKISGDNMADLYFLTTIPLPPTTPYTFEGQLKKKDAVWRSEGFTTVVGDSDLTGDLSFDTSSERALFKADLHSNLLESRDLGGFIGLDPAATDPVPDEDKPQDAKAEEEQSNAKVIPDVPLALERLRATDLDVTLTAKEINAPNLPFKGMEVRFNLREGHLVLDPLNIVLADGTIDGTIDIDGQEDAPPMKLDLNIKNIRLGRFFDGTRFAETTEGVFGGTVVLAGTGSSLAKVLASSNGEMTIIMSDGTISRLLIEASELDIAGVIPLFLGSDESTRIRCAVTDFDVTDGLLTSEILVFDTENSTVLGEMEIDLNDESMNAVLKAEPKEGSILSAQTPLVVSGTLKNPSVGLDAEKGFARGAAAITLGALLTPFAAILAFVDTGDGEDSNCSALISEAKN